MVDGQTVRVGASADWWMEWFLNGRCVYDTLKHGNGGAQTLSAHTFELPLKAGWNLLAVRVLGGSQGWRLLAGGPEATALALASGAPPQRLELILADPQGKQLAKRILPVAAALAAPPTPKGFDFAKLADWQTAEPTFLLGESQVTNLHVQHPDSSRWYAGPNDLSATVWLRSQAGRLLLAVCVKDNRHAPADNEGDELVLTFSGEQPRTVRLRCAADGPSILTPADTDAVKARTVREGDRTWYLLSLAPHQTAPSIERFQLRVNDNDGDGVKQLLKFDIAIRCFAPPDALSR